MERRVCVSFFASSLLDVFPSGRVRLSTSWLLDMSISCLRHDIHDLLPLHLYSSNSLLLDDCAALSLEFSIIHIHVVARQRLTQRPDGSYC